MKRDPFQDRRHRVVKAGNKGLPPNWRSYELEHFMSAADLKGLDPIIPDGWRGWIGDGLQHIVSTDGTAKI